MNDDEYKSIMKFFSWEENRLGNIFTGQSNTNVKSVAKGVLQGIFMGRFTTIRSYNDKALNKIQSYYTRKLADNEVRVISSQKMIQFLNRFANVINERDKSFWKSTGATQLGYIRCYQRAQQYATAVKVFEIQQKINEETKQDNSTILTRKEAIEQLLELKKLLDANVITQEEFDKKASPLKKIIL